MTNEEKAAEIGELFELSMKTPEMIGRLAAEEMAYWKDEQYRALLNLLIETGAKSEIIYEFIKVNDIEL